MYFFRTCTYTAHVSMLEHHLQWHNSVKCLFQYKHLFCLHSTVMLYNPLLLLYQQYFHYSHYTVSHLFCDNSAPDPTSPRPLWAQERFFSTLLLILFFKLRRIHMIPHQSRLIPTRKGVLGINLHTGNSNMIFTLQDIDCSDAYFW